MSDTTTEVTEWDTILAKEADDGLIRTVVARSAAEVDSFLGSDDETEEETLALLGRRLSGQIGTTTYDVVLDTLSALVGEDGGALVHWYTVGEGASTGIVDEVAPPRVAFFMRRIAAAHLPELKAAFATWKDGPEDWHRIARDVYYDHLNEKYVVRTLIEKNNGDEFVVEGDANSGLDLARSLIISIRLVGTRGAFSEPQIEAFLEEVDLVLAMLKPEEEQSQDSNGDVAVEDIGPPGD